MSIKSKLTKAAIFVGAVAGATYLIRSGKLTQGLQIAADASASLTAKVAEDIAKGEAAMIAAEAVVASFKG